MARAYPIKLGRVYAYAVAKFILQFWFARLRHLRYKNPVDGVFAKWTGADTFTLLPEQKKSWN